MEELDIALTCSRWSINRLMVVEQLHLDNNYIFAFTNNLKIC